MNAHILAPNYPIPALAMSHQTQHGFYISVSWLANIRSVPLSVKPESSRHFIHIYVFPSLNSMNIFDSSKISFAFIGKCHLEHENEDKRT